MSKTNKPDSLVLVGALFSNETIVAMITEIHEWAEEIRQDGVATHNELEVVRALVEILEDRGMNVHFTTTVRLETNPMYSAGIDRIGQTA